ncbi:hypothetical protein TrVE_jg5452 [Triparma verrucosa]|uniref:Sfi1 spindle body domain-containing protein n=1 Tax=Triparma verrucosa TaxID=1606542 RepID=A0A9W7B879_9STRA|nr:hypothetical protein TrVE_jg5452 [Triparma verrucosa]
MEYLRSLGISNLPSEILDETDDRPSNWQLKFGGVRRSGNGVSKPPVGDARPKDGSRNYDKFEEAAEAAPTPRMVSPSPQKQSRRSKRRSKTSASPTTSSSTAKTSSVTSDVQLSASGIDLRNWIKGVQEKADQEARAKDVDCAAGWADRRKRGGNSARRNDLPNLRSPSPTNVFDSTDKWLSSAVENDQDLENRQTSKDQSVKEARLILSAYNKVESVAGETRVKKFGKIGAEEFISRVRSKQKGGPESGRAREREAPAATATTTTTHIPPPVQIPPPPTNHQISQTKINHKKASVELAKAHNVAIKISLQRSRRRTLRSCFKNIAMFIINEEMRLVEFKDRLSLRKDIRMKILLFRSWKEYNKRLKIQTSRLMNKRNMKTLRGVFNVWFEVTKDNLLFLEKHHEMKEWRTLGKCFKILKIWARDCRRGREEAQKEIERRKFKAMEEKALRYYRANLLGSTFLQWSVSAKEACERRKLAQQQDRRRSRVQALLERVKDKVEETETEEDNADSTIPQLVTAKEGGDDDLASVDSRRRVKALRSLIDKCLEEEEGILGAAGAGLERVVEEEEDIFVEDETAIGDGSRRGPPPPPPSASDISAITTSTRATSANPPQSVISMFKRHKERAQKRAALSARYDAINSERLKRKDELAWKRQEEAKQRIEDEKRAKMEEKRQLELKEQRKRDEFERRREQMKLAKMHNLMTRYSAAFSTWFGLVKELRLKERKADVFNEDITLACYWKRLVTYVEARKDLKRDLEARAMRKADEYAYDVLCWKVFNGWRGNMLKLMAKAKAVRRQAKYKIRERTFALWRRGLDKERLIWWEVNKHASVTGKRCNLRYFWGAFKERIQEHKEERMEEEMVKKKMMEVQKWLE